MTAQATAVNVTGSAVVSAGPCTYRGVSLRDAGAMMGTTITVYDNAAAASGTVLAAFQVGQGAHVLDNPGDGIRAANGIYLQTTNAVVGSVRVG